MGKIIWLKGMLFDSNFSLFLYTYAKQTIWHINSGAHWYHLGQTKHLLTAICSGKKSLFIEVSIQCVKCGTKGQSPFACMNHFEILQLGAHDLPLRDLTILKRRVAILGCGGRYFLCILAMVCLGRHQSSTNWKSLKVEIAFHPKLQIWTLFLYH